MFQAFMKACALQMGINYAKMNFSIGIAKAFNPNRDMRQKPQKGEKIFDWENAKWFALNGTDCQKIMDYLRQPNGDLFLTHDSGNGNYNYFKFNINGDSTFIGIGPKGDMANCGLYGENYAAFISGIQFLLNQVPWYNDFLKEMGKIIAGQSAFNPGNGPDGKPWGQNNNNYNGNGNYNPNNGDGEWSNSVSYTPGPDTGYQQPQQNNYNGGYQKKQYSNNGYQKKSYGNGGYQRNNYGNNYQQNPAPVQPPRPPQAQQPAPMPPQSQAQSVPMPPAPPAVDNFTI